MRSSFKVNGRKHFWWMNCPALRASPDSLDAEVGAGHKAEILLWKNHWLMKLTAVTLWASGIYAPVGCWKHCCFIAPLLSVMSLIKFSTVVVWRLFEDKYFSACSGVLTRAKSGGKKKKSISVPDASGNLDFIFLWRCVCRRGEIGVRTAASGICKQIAKLKHNAQGCPVSECM